MLKFDLERLLNDINAGYKKRTVQFKGKPCIRYELEHCFFDASHVNNDACFSKYENDWTKRKPSERVIANCRLIEILAHNMAGKTYANS